MLFHVAQRYQQKWPLLLGNIQSSHLCKHLKFMYLHYNYDILTLLLKTCELVYSTPCMDTILWT